MTFQELKLHDSIQKALLQEGYVDPTPIQAQAIPPALEGRDVLGCAQTGTGKTAAFALPILERLFHGMDSMSSRQRPIRALILTPTRELAMQIQESFVAYGRHLPLRSMVVFGGVSQRPQTEELARGCDILVATPGRLNDLIGQGFIKLSQVEFFVLDEADRMLDMGFIVDVKKVVRLLPESRQTMLFSATMPEEIEKLADALLEKPVKIAVTPPATTVELIEQSVYMTDKLKKRDLLVWVLQNPSIYSAIVFTRTKHGADRVAKTLNGAKISALAIHGDKSQGARQLALSNFKSGRVRVLVATDIAARGIDIDQLSHVINYELPNEPETYVHRIGRTGRAGADGAAISFCDWDEKPYLKDIEALIKMPIRVETEHPYPMELFESLPKLPRPPRKPRNDGQREQAHRQDAPKKESSAHERRKPRAGKSEAQSNHKSRDSFSHKKGSGGKGKQGHF